MQIKLNKKFDINLNIIIDYITQDKLSAAKKFRANLFNQINSLPNFPYKCRQSYYDRDKNVRDMIFKGYTIVYEVDISNSIIIILNIFNKNKPTLTT